MRLLFALLALAVSACASQVDAQARPRGRPPPPGLVAQLHADLDPADLFSEVGIDSLAAGITVERRDLDGDGVPEYLVEGTRYCGANCSRWIYRRLPGGRFAQVLADIGRTTRVLPARRNGWHSISEYFHLSCCAGTTSLYAFDGRRYRWLDTRHERSRDGDSTRTVFHVGVTPPWKGGRRRLELDPVDAGGGLSISARYDLCGRGRRCEPPQMRLSSTKLPARRVCVSVRSRPSSLSSTPQTMSLCGVTRSDAAAQTRSLVLRPSRAQWARLSTAEELAFAGPGMPGRIGGDAQYAVGSFASSLAEFYHLPCPPDTFCSRSKRP
jgi:hypothetical protein